MQSPLDIPYNRLLRLRESADLESLYELPDEDSIRNHLGTVHAAAQFSLAEASSAKVLTLALAEEFPNPFAVVRRFEGKFRNPLRGRVRARGTFDPIELERVLDNLRRKRRSSAAVNIEVIDDSGAVGLRVDIEWYIETGRTEESNEHE